MMFPNNNKAIIRKLTFKTLKAGKLRNIMVILAVALTTALFTSLFTITMGIAETMQQQTMRQSGGSAHGTFKYLNQEEFDRLKDHPLIKDIQYSLMLGMCENPQLIKHHTEIRYATDGDAKLNFSYPATGRMPEKDNEIVCGTLVLDLLGIPRTIGEKLTIHYNIAGKKYEKEFILSGFYEQDGASGASMMYVALPFVKNALYKSDAVLDKSGAGEGCIFADVMFENSWDIENKMQTVIRERGYSTVKDDPGEILYGVNWAYMSTNFDLDPGGIITVLGVTALIIFTGYLIIYNIFQISVVRDIRFYGLLKTIGTTSRQIKRIILNQAFLLSMAGIPLGLSVGYLLGCVLLPAVMRITKWRFDSVSFSPFIFVFASLFSLITVWVSAGKPGRIAANVSAVDAVRYTGAGQGAAREKHFKRSKKGNKIYRMAFSNIIRNKGKSIIVIVSISLGLILMNSVYTLTNGFDMDKFLNKVADADFVLGHARLFKSNFQTENDAVSPIMIQKIRTLTGIKGGGRIYYNLEKAFSSFHGKDMILQLYGMEDFPLKKLKVVEGDANKLKTGNYIIAGVNDNDNGRVQWDSCPYKLGDKVKIISGKTSKEYEIAAKAVISHSLGVRYYMEGVTMYLPAKEFAALVKKPVTMSYVFDVNNGSSKEIENYLDKYTKNIEPVMDYQSKGRFVNEFTALKNIFLTVGGILSLIIGFIGALNFINSTLTGIIARRREFAVLESIGMTGAQLIGMLMLEGLLFAGLTLMAAFGAGSLFSLTVLKAAPEILWFFSYRFTLLPLILSIPVLLLFSAVIPAASLRLLARETIVERLRITE